MNNFFKSLWNETSGTYVAASEIATAGGCKTASTRAARKMPRRGGNQRLVLEPRIVFDGAMPVAAADAVETKTADTAPASKEASAVAPPTTNTPSESTLQPAQSAQQEREVIDGTLALSGQTSNEIIFIDSAVEGLQDFLLDHQQADVVLLDEGSDGMEQIAAALEGRTDIDAIHIISHGSSGELNLGNDTFNLESMNGEHADELATIKSALSAKADILIYGCDVGANESGQAFIAALTKATGADIAASTDLTGSADLGGDWDLEHTSGDIESSVVLDSDLTDGYSGLLAVVNVNQTADILNGDTSSIANLIASDGGDGISLREAIEAANNTAGADTINLQADVYTLALGTLTINSDITITGTAVDQTFIDGASLSGVLSITSGTVNISDLTIQDGAAVNGAGMLIGASANVTLNNVVLNGNTASNDGGVIESAGTLLLNNVVFSGNTAGDDGGAIENNGIMSMTNVTLDNNTAVDDGGAINNTGTLTMTDVTVSNNTAGDNGGGISNRGVLQINGGTFSNNTTVDNGGAIFDSGTNFSAVNVTISGNTADRGGGLYENSSNPATLSNVTITDNTGTSRSGGVEVRGGRLLSMHNTIIAGNFAPTPAEVDLRGTITSLGNNLIGVSAAGSGYIGSDILDVAPIFGALAFNGGPTQTHALLFGSRGIEEGSNTGAPAADQRGVLRNATTDIGAYEFVPNVLDPIVDLNSDPTVTVTGPVVTSSTSTTDLVTSGDFGTTASGTPPAPWVESGQTGRGSTELDGGRCALPLAF